MSRIIRPSLALALGAAVFVLVVSRRDPPEPVMLLAATSECPLTSATQRPAGPGIALSWTVRERPEAPCSVGFVLPPGFVVGEATAIDAKGTATRLTAHVHQTSVRYQLSADLLASAHFPLVVDPLVTPAVTASVFADTPSGRGVNVATNGAEWLLLGSTSRGTRQFLQRIAPGGQVTTAQVSGGSTLLFTDKYLLLGGDTLRSGTFADLVDGGSVALPAHLVGVQSYFPGPNRTVWSTIPGQTLPDGGPGFAVRRLGPDLEWDAGEFLLGGFAPNLTTEGSTLYATSALNVPPYGFAAALDLDGNQRNAITFPDGGVGFGQFFSNGTDTTLHVWTVFDTGRSWMNAQLMSGGIPVGGILDLDDGQQQALVAAAWDGVAFRLVNRAPDNSTRELFITSAGVVTGWTVVAGTGSPGPFDSTSVWAISPADAGTLTAWSPGTPGERYPRAFVAAPGSAHPYSGTALFTTPNVVLAPFITRRSGELLVGWNDTRQGGESHELWVRRFDLDLRPLDPDSHDATFVVDSGAHYNFNDGWLNYGQQVVAPTNTGFDLLRTDSFNITLHRLDSNGVRIGAELLVSDRLGLNIAPAIASNGQQTLLTWAALNLGADLEFMLFDSSGALGPPVTLGSAYGALLSVLPSGDFLVLERTTTSIVFTDGGTAPGPWTAPAGFEFAGLARGQGEEHLAVFIDVPLRTSFSTALMWLDGGTQPLSTTLSGPTVFGAAPAWDERNYYLYAVLGLADAGREAVVLKRFDDGGWSAAQSIASGPQGIGVIQAVPDAGLVLASGGIPGPIVLQRIVWLRDGDGCGAPTDCESGFCVDGVCCASSCGGGAVDCQACSLLQGATADGVCTVLASTTCRSAQGSCDVAERCDGVSPTCPADLAADAGTRCRTANGACDVDDVCDGVSMGCADSVLDAGITCRASTGVCDRVDVCDGLSTTCLDLVADAGTPCRPVANVCDAPEQCDGLSSVCGVDLESDAGLAECQPTTVTFTAAATASCDVPQVLSWVQSGRAATLEFRTEPSLELTADAGTLSWTPHEASANGTLFVTSGGLPLAEVALRSDCVPRQLAVGCSCSTNGGALITALVSAVVFLRRRRR